MNITVVSVFGSLQGKYLHFTWKSKIVLLFSDLALVSGYQLDLTEAVIYINRSVGILDWTILSVSEKVHHDSNSI